MVRSSGSWRRWIGGGGMAKLPKLPKMPKLAFFSGKYAKFWNSLLTGAAVGAGGVLVNMLVSMGTGWFEGPNAQELESAVDTLWVALCAAAGAALAANSGDDQPKK